MTAIPASVTRSMIDAGAEVRTSSESAEHKLMQVRFGSAAYTALESWISSSDLIDPNVQCIVAPRPAIAATSLFPGFALAGLIAVSARGRQLACTPRTKQRRACSAIAVPRLASSLYGTPLQNEANWAVTHHAALMAPAFAGGLPAIPPPGQGPPPHAWVDIHHAKLALHACMAFIQHAPPAYPTLAALPPGSYICDFTEQWANHQVSIQLFKS